jgi:hypothetical protein
MSLLSLLMTILMIDPHSSKNFEWIPLDLKILPSNQIQNASNIRKSFNTLTFMSTLLQLHTAPVTYFKDELHGLYFQHTSDADKLIAAVRLNFFHTVITTLTACQYKCKTHPCITKACKPCDQMEQKGWVRAPTTYPWENSPIIHCKGWQVGSRVGVAMMGKGSLRGSELQSSNLYTNTFQPGNNMQYLSC